MPSVNLSVEQIDRLLEKLVIREHHDIVLVLAEAKLTAEGKVRSALEPLDRCPVVGFAGQCRLPLQHAGVHNFPNPRTG